MIVSFQRWGEMPASEIEIGAGVGGMPPLFLAVGSMR